MSILKDDPSLKLVPAIGDDWGKEFLSLIAAVKIVDSLDEALEHVRVRQREDDVIAVFAPHTALIVFGRVDYYAQEHGYPSIEGESGRVDIWTGTPVLDSVDELTTVLDAGERVWLIVHRDNWQRHYTDDYRDIVDARMERVFDGTGTLVYFLEPH